MSRWKMIASNSDRQVVVMLSVFGDESSDETKQRVFAVAGVVGSEDQWKALESLWTARTNGVPFHANNCDSDQGDFENCSHQDNKALYRDLAIMLAESGLGGWGLALDLIAQRRIFPEAPIGLAYYKGFLEVIEKMKNCAAYNRETVEFTFDMRTEGGYNAGVLYKMAFKTRDWAKYLTPKISFACSRKHPRVQTADLFARETMKALDNKIGPKKRPMRKSWKCLFDTGRFHIDALSDNWFSDLQKQMPDLERHTGMSMAEYTQWLIKNKRQADNISNRFEYMSYVIERDGE